jgi:ABC-type nitrate/sulfonate/bicarbonate transport system substrate-binding protein
MNGIRWIAAAVTIPTAMLLLAADGQGSAARAQQPEKALVRIATARGVDHVALWGMGPFAKKYGLRTEMIVAVTNADQQRAIQVGGADVASLGYQSPAIMAEQNVTNIKIISGIYLGGQNLIVRKGVNVRTWKDLEGKKIGRAPGTFAQILFILAAEANNVDVSKINLVNVTAVGTAELQALKNGDLDGLVLFSPTIDRGVVEGYAYYPPCCDISSTTTFGGRNQILGANTEFLKHRQTVVNFLKAFVEAENYYAHNRAKAIDVVTQFTGVGKDVVDEALKHATLEYRVDVATAVAVAKQGPKFGFTKADMSDKVASYFDLSYLSEATGKPIDQLNILPK